MKKTVLIEQGVAHCAFRIFLLFTFSFSFPMFCTAQEAPYNLNSFEISVKYAAQCPLYSVNTPLDLFLQQDTRYKSRISIGVKYYPYKCWFTEYLLSLSQQGGGYKKQRTNANYFSNSFLLGYSALHSKRFIFNMFCGIETNSLINARFINTITKEKENVSDYFNRFSLSFPFGMGVKTKIADNYYIGCNTFFSFSPYKISKEPEIKVSQVIFPAFQLSLSKFIK